ncbi:hypothetical protein QW71_11505 [Paenibacillus sp. IHB B 3415]|uniref:hypothetical protein n=1 Tax=Paenibacillus sp. IHB B 3415 TaxID=867080 RepID=UPI0005759020|nr:hypothetical protein [Paenibacillus sp. IHB B 3415]KHL95581.1 hypothetical protein QW71_11505 [Paenibacillus sp. IHB B 3415]
MNRGIINKIDVSRNCGEYLDFRPLLSPDFLIHTAISGGNPGTKAGAGGGIINKIDVSRNCGEYLDFRPLLSPDFLIHTAISGGNPGTKAVADAPTVPKFPSVLSSFY